MEAIIGKDGREFHIGDTVQHFKRVQSGKDEFPGTTMFQYKVIGLAMSTADLERLVIYQALYEDGKLWARPIREFFSKVDKSRFPSCGQDFRFIKVQDGTEEDNK